MAGSKKTTNKKSKANPISKANSTSKPKTTSNRESPNILNKAVNKLKGLSTANKFRLLGAGVLAYNIAKSPFTKSLISDIKQKFFNKFKPSSAFKSKYNLDNLEVIGSGTFGSVFRTNLRSDPNVKVILKYQKIDTAFLNILNGVDSPVIKNEKEVLNLIKQIKCNGISEFIESEFYTDPQGVRSFVAVYKANYNNTLTKFLCEVKMDIKDKYNVIQSLLEAINCMHTNKIAHSDIKPDNIIIGKKADGSYGIEIIDFGLSCISPFLGNCQFSYGGTWYFMPPEYRNKFINAMTNPPFIPFTGGTPFNEIKRFDIWAIGMCIYFIILNSCVNNIDEDAIAIKNYPYMSFSDTKFQNMKPESNISKFLFKMMPVDPSKQWSISQLLEEWKKITIDDLTAF